MAKRKPFEHPETPATNRRKKSHPPASDTSRPYTFPIVGIGASAGGLSGFEALFSNMPADQDIGMAFVIIQHLSPDYKSALTDIIGRYTKMPVEEATDGILMLPNHVYIIPPNCDMALRSGLLKLFEPVKPHGLRSPIDFFFQSLAEELKEQAIAIILSGTGNDGTKGARAIKAADGMVMVQRLNSAEYDSMPRNVLEAGLADFELLPREMPERLLNYGRQRRNYLEKSEQGWTSRDDSALQKIFALLRVRSGHDFSRYKPDMVRRRIGRRLLANKLETLPDYAALLQKSPEEVDALFRDLLIGVTQFFRDPETFRTIEQKVIPLLFAGKPAGTTIRVWVAGCATGEEAYSFAILLQEYIERMKTNYHIQIFASDIDSQAITDARAGLYPVTIRDDVSTDRLARFFTLDSESNMYRINRAIRNMITFSEQSVIKDPPFSRLDLISCRNLLIYMSSSLQAKLFPIFHYALNPKGILVLGPSESLGDFESIFLPLDRKAKIFQRKESDQVVRQLLLTPAIETFYARDPMRIPAPEPKAPAKRLSLLEITERALLDTWAPVAVLVSENGDILYYHGHTGRFLEPAPGEANVSNVLTMAREGLAPELSMAFNEARSQQKAVFQPHVKVKTNGHHVYVDLTVNPVSYEASTRLLKTAAARSTPAMPKAAQARPANRRRSSPKTVPARKRANPRENQRFPLQRAAPST